MTEYSAASHEISQAFHKRDLWVALGSWDIKRMYRRSVLGPIWLTISTAIFVFGIGFLYGVLLKQPMAQYLPHLAIGYVVWLFVSGSIVAGTTALLQEGAILKQIAIGSPTVILRVIWRQILISLHQALVPLAVLLFYHEWPQIGLLWLVPGILLLVVNASWMTALIAIASVRFRDVPPIIGNFVQILFFLTPVMWAREGLGDQSWLVDLNPFAHLIEIVRAPLMGKPVPYFAVLFSTALAIAGCAATFAIYARTRNRLVYWL